MTTSRPRVAGTWLHVSGGEEPPITVGSTAWYDWLEANRSFEYADGAEVFVALKERSRRAGTFWRAFRRQDGATRRTYLGRSRDLTLDRLVAAGRALIGELTPPVAVAPATRDQGGMLRARLGAPPMRRGCVARERLLDRLRDDDASLTLVVAPAGYGKTTLLAHWLTAGARRAVWLSLEPTDDDPRRFWESVLDGLDTLSPGVVVRARALLPALSVTGATAFLPTLLDDLATGLTVDERGRPMVLVLDDYHVITSPLVHESIAALVERLPPTLRLVISGRESPPLPVPRLRARGRLIELRATDLAFTADEIRRFLSETMGLAVDAETVAALAGRTEGWAAALQIAALGLRDRADPAAFVSSFRGSHRHVVDFLVTEVIDRQPAEIRGFLLRTAVLDQLSAPLCDALLAVGDDEAAVRIDASDAPPSSQAVLERLEDGGLFVAPLDDTRTRYRYHHLFAEVLLQRLRAEAPGLELTLRRRAAAWCEAAGLPAQAIEQALAGEDWERAARLIARLADPLWRQGDIATLERWMAALPANLARSRPQLALARAAIAYVSRDYHRLLQLEGELEDSLDHIGDASVEPDGASRSTVLRARASVLRAMAASLRGNGASARALAGEALATLPAGDTEWRAFAQFQAYYLAHMSDDLNAAGRHAAESMALADAAGDRFLVVILLLQQAHLLHDRGRLTAAEAHLARARGVVERLGARGLPEAAALDNVAALVRYDRNDLAAVERLLSATWALPTAEGRSLLGFWAGTILARLRAAYGDFDGAYGALEEAEGRYRLAAPMDGTWSTWRAHVIPAWRARLDAARGDLGAVRAWANEATRSDLTEAPLGYWAHGAIPPMLARARLLTGDPPGALVLLERWRARAEAGGAGRALLELTVLEALALETLGRREAAVDALARGLELGAPEGALRPFLDEGEPVAELARRVAGRGGKGAAHARVLLAAFGADSSAPAGRPDAVLVERLTEREAEVLGLAAEGLSNAGIAERLVLSVGTVKWHLRAIYGKLGAERRTDALARARAIGLLD